MIDSDAMVEVVSAVLYPCSSIKGVQKFLCTKILGIHQILTYFGLHSFRVGSSNLALHRNHIPVQFGDFEQK
jgi:hypothetical protein